MTCKICKRDKYNNATCTCNASLAIKEKTKYTCHKRLLDQNETFTIYMIKM